MSRQKKHDQDGLDGKSAGAGEEQEQPDAAAPAAPEVFGPLDAEQAITELIELNHERMRCASRWEDAKAEASEAKKELDAASNAISLLIDRIDRQQNGTEGPQPFLQTLGGHAEAGTV